MKRYEKEEIERLPHKYRPLGAWSYFGYQLLFSIPLIGLICLLIFAFSNENINRRSFARSYFCNFLISGILITILIVIFIVVLVDYWDYIIDYLIYFNY